MLRERGARVAYSNPLVPVFPRIRNYEFDMHGVALTPAVLADYDVVLLATDQRDNVVRASALSA